MKIAIAGYGVEGEANYRYWATELGDQVTIVDEVLVPKRPLPEDVVTMLGAGAFERLNGFDIVVRTAGLMPSKIKTDGKIWSATNEFFEKCPADIIGVTGSKGKGTTASLIASILEAAGQAVWLVGNIGTPALSLLDRIQPGDIVVYELSSFQLWDITRSPSTAVVLFIEQEHLDMHRSMDDYVQAKANITRFQTDQDLLIFNGDNQYARTIAELSKAKKVSYPDEATAHIRDGYFYYGEQKLCSVDVLQLRGEHNQSNAIAAIDAVMRYSPKPTEIKAGLHAFKGLPHRLSFVKSVDGVEYYDDSIATTPTAAIAALRSFTGPKVIILGGSSKGSDFRELAEELRRHDVHVLLIGDEAETIAKACYEAGFEQFSTIIEPTMKIVVHRAKQIASAGSVVLLSPASASFGLFKNYVDRGEQFIAAVENL